MTEPKGKIRSPEEGHRITRNEILEVMADGGYSADDRKAWLKDVLTQVAQGKEHDDDPEREKLMAEIRQILHGQVSDHPEADDST